MTIDEHEEKIVEVLESYREDYLDELHSDLKRYEEEALRYYMKQKINPAQKIIDFQFDAMAKGFVDHKIRMVKEEIDVLENLDITILDDLAYIFDSYSFTFSNKEEKEPDVLPLWFIDNFISAPIFNAILYLEKYKRRNIKWKNFSRDLGIFKTQLDGKLNLTENFFSLIPVASEDEILRTFLTRMHVIYIEPQQEGIKEIISILFEKKKKLPKEQEAYMKTLLSEAGYYNNHESKPDYTLTLPRE